MPSLARSLLPNCYVYFVLIFLVPIFYKMACRPGGGWEVGANNAYFATLLPEGYVCFVVIFLLTSNE